MRWRDTADRFGTVSIINHWLLAAVVIALLASGLVIGGWILVAAVAGHALVALKHHLVDHDATFARMVAKAT
jgi:cytochrome b561